MPAAGYRPRVGHAALAITTLISLAYLVVPVYDGSDGPLTVVQANGTWVVLVLAVPVASALLPLLAPVLRRNAWGAAAA